MSHNKLKVGNVAPDETGSISVQIEDLSDVTISSPLAGHVLRYDSSDSKWKNQNQTSESLFVGDGTSQAYSTSSASSTSSGAVVEFYTANLINSVSESQVTSNLNWVQSVSLGEGAYLVEAVVGLTFSSSSGVATYRVYRDATALGSSGIVSYDNQDVGSRAVALVEVASGSTASVTIRLTSSTSANAVSAQGNRQAERGYLEIRRV